MATKYKVNYELKGDSAVPVTRTNCIKHGDSMLNTVIDGKADVSAISTISNRVSDVETEQEALSTRMDTFTTLSEGSTTGDAELADIRVAENGNTYTNAGTAVRTQISEVKNDISHINDTTSETSVNYYSHISEDNTIDVKWIHGGYNEDFTHKESNMDMCIENPIYGINNNLYFDFSSFANYYKYLMYIYMDDGTTLTRDFDVYGIAKISMKTLGTSNGKIARILMRKKDLSDVSDADVVAINNTTIKLIAPIKNPVTKISLVGEYIENGAMSEMNNDWIYTLGDLYVVQPEYTKIKMVIPSHGGDITLYLTDMQFRVVYKHDYTLTNGLNTIEIDTSSYAQYLKVNVYCKSKGAMLSQNKKLFANATNYSNASPMTFYTAYSSSIVVGSIFDANYWSGNLNSNQTYACMDFYAYKLHEADEKIIVAKDGSGNYTTIMDAVRNCGDISHPCTITIKEGTYNEVVYLGNKHNISLEGTSRDKCIIKTTTGIYSDSPIVITGGFEIRNLTAKAEYDGTWTPEYGENVFTTYPGYALHIDGNSKDTTKNEIGRIINCTLYSEAFPAVGMGTNKNQNIVFENCEMIRNCTHDVLKKDNWKGAFLCHASNYSDSANQVLTLKNNVIRSNYGVSGNIRGDLAGSQYFTVEAINNTCYSDETGFTFEYVKGSSHLSGISHGNTASSLNATI